MREERNPKEPLESGLKFEVLAKEVGPSLGDS